MSLETGDRLSHIPTYLNILGPTFLYALTIFMVYPVEAQVLIKLACKELQDGINCDNADVSSRASMISGDDTTHTYV
jgi:hypothetical protein